MSSPHVTQDHVVSSPSLLNRLLTLVRRPQGSSTVKNQENSLRRRFTRRTLKKKPKNVPRRRIPSARRPVTAAGVDVGLVTKYKPRAEDIPQRRVTIDTLPEDALLVIFSFYLDGSEIPKAISMMNDAAQGSWHTLVHVCQKWRNLVFHSPHRLNVQLRCTPKTPAMKRMLDVWPDLPIAVNHFGPTAGDSEWGMHSIVTALKRNDRVCQIALKPIPGWKWGKFMTALSQPFPALTHLRLKSDDERETPPVAPESFLGGSTPRLRFLWLERIPFPGLPNLLLTATTTLVDLRLWEIPHSGYISPEAMATCLSALTRLERLDLEFESSQSRPDQESHQSQPSSTRFVLPALTRFWFRGTSEYLNDLVARIDTPLLNGFFVCLFHQLIFDTPQLAHFISRTPTLRLHNQSQMLCFSDWGASVVFLREGSSDRALQLGILCGQPDLQLSSLAQVCTSSFPRAFIPAVEHLTVLEETLSPPHWQDNSIENSRWLELLQPFTAVKNLYLSREFAPRIAHSLRELVAGRATEALPALKRLFLEELHPSRPVQKAIGMFIAARDHPITISEWEREGCDWNVW